MKRLVRLYVIILILLSGCSADLENAKYLAEKSQAAYTRAVASYQRLLAKNKKNDGLRLELARLHFGHGDYDSAIVVLKDSESQKSKMLLAVALYKSGDYTQALSLFEKLGKIQDGEYLYYYGLTCKKHNLYEQTLESLSRIKDKVYAPKAQELIKSIQGSTREYLQNTAPELKEAILNATQEKYPLAGAVIILADEDIRLLKDDTVVSESRFIIKILNERGKNDFSEIVIGYDSTYEKVEVEYARTISPDGQVIAVGEKDMRDVSLYLNFPLYSNARARIISMPGLVEGSIVEYKVRHQENLGLSKKGFNLAYSLKEGQPIADANFKLTVPKNKNLKTKVLNSEYNLEKLNLSPLIIQTRDEKIYTWDFQNIPQIEVEPNMPPAAEINPIILVSTYQSWDEIYKWWRELAKDRMFADKAISEKVAQLIQGKKNKEEIIRAIYNYCAQDIRYVGIEYGQAGYQPHYAAEIFKNKYGDCKDKAILFITMLKSAGVSAYPVLIGTRGNPATQEDFPADIFNHCIAAVELDGRLIFLDITAEVCSFGDLPAGDQQRRVLIFREDRYEIAETPLLSPQQNRITYVTRMNIAKDESVFAQRQVEGQGEFDQAQRYWLRYTQPDLIEQGLKERVQSMVVSGDLIKYNYENADDLNTPIRLTYEFQGKNFLWRSGRARIIPPLAAIDASIAAKSIRGYPLELGQPDSKESVFEIKLEKNFILKYLPEKVDVQSPWLDYLVNYEFKGQVLKVSQRETLKLRQVSQKEYPEFKIFLENLAGKLKEYIILEKK